MDEKIKIKIPSSSANVGLGYDIWSLALEKPSLKLIYLRKPKEYGIKIDAKSNCEVPSERKLGYAGKIALEKFFEQMNIDEGAHLFYEDNEDYPIGGLGRSGAEAVGAITAANIIYNKGLSSKNIIKYSAKAEPGEHKDNVAASTNGGFNIIAILPATKELSVYNIDAPENLGIAIGYSSHKKTQGTEGMRKVLQEPVSAEDFVAQSGLLSMATAALVNKDTDKFLELVWADRFHEPRRANIGGYGNFTMNDFEGLKLDIFNKFNVSLNVSGAGPNMQFLYNKNKYKEGIGNIIQSIVIPWFKEKGIEMKIKETEIAKIGVCEYN